MKLYTYILFDMDGTLIDSAPGILSAVRYAQKALSLPTLPEEKLLGFLGPPLKAAFMDIYGLSESEAEDATKAFRVYYGETGLFQCKLYDGVCQLLGDLQTAGKKLYIATSKPSVYARKIAEQQGIAGFFTDIVGSHLDNTRSRKADVIRDIVSGLPKGSARACVMIGDKAQDIVGAKANGMDAIGVRYGFGTEEELRKERPATIVADVEALKHLLV